MGGCALQLNFLAELFPPLPEERVRPLLREEAGCNMEA